MDSLELLWDEDKCDNGAGHGAYGVNGASGLSGADSVNGAMGAE